MSILYDLLVYDALSELFFKSKSSGNIKRKKKTRFNTWYLIKQNFLKSQNSRLECIHTK